MTFFLKVSAKLCGPEKTLDTKKMKIQLLLID